MFKGKHKQRNQDKCRDDTSLAHLTQLSIKPRWNIFWTSCSGHTSSNWLIFQCSHMLSVVQKWCLISSPDQADIRTDTWTFGRRSGITDLDSRDARWWQIPLDRKGPLQLDVLWVISLRCYPVCYHCITVAQHWPLSIQVGIKSHS